MDDQHFNWRTNDIMKRQKFYIIFIAIALCFSCEISTGPSAEIISIVLVNNQLRITNNSGQTLYLFLVEQDVAALILWAPHFADPNVAYGRSILIPYSEIVNGSTEPVKFGDKIIIYYWDGSDRDEPQVFSKVIQL